MRVAGWPRKLNEYLIDAQRRYVEQGFAYGRLDCAIFAADWIKLCTMDDPLAPFRGRYTSLEEAQALIVGDGSLAEAVGKRLVEVAPALAQRGDVAYAELAGDPCLGLFFTSGARMSALFLGNGGFALHPLSRVSRAFKVGRE